MDVPRDLLAGPVVVTEVPDGQGGWGAWSGVEIDKDDGPAVSQRQQGRAVGRVSDALWADQAVECLEQLLFGTGAVELDVVAAHVELCEPAVPHNLGNGPRNDLVCGSGHSTHDVNPPVSIIVSSDGQETPSESVYVRMASVSGADRMLWPTRSPCS